MKIYNNLTLCTGLQTYQYCEHKHTLSVQSLKVSLLFQKLKDQQAAPRQLSARPLKFTSSPVLPRMFPKFIFSQVMCQAWISWKGGDGEAIPASPQAPHHGTHITLVSKFWTRAPDRAQPLVRQMQVAHEFLEGERDYSCLPTI